MRAGQTSSAPTKLELRVRNARSEPESDHAARPNVTLVNHAAQASRLDTLPRANQSAKFGAQFITFNVGGNPKKANGYFKDIAGNTIDTFSITAD